MEEWVLANRHKLLDALSPCLPGVVNEFIGEEAVTLAAFSPKEFELDERSPMEVEILPGYRHKVCFLSVSSIERENQFLDQILSGPRIFASFFSQERHESGQGLLSVSSEHGTALILVNDGGQTRIPSARDFLRRLQELPVGISPAERELAQKAGISFSEAIPGLSENFFKRATYLRESIHRNSRWVDPTLLANFKLTRGIMRMKSKIFLGYANRSFLAFFLDHEHLPARSNEDIGAIANELKYGVPYCVSNNEHNFVEIQKVDEEEEEEKVEVDLELKSVLEQTSFAFGGETEIVPIDVTKIIVSPPRVVKVTGEFWSSLRAIEAVSVRNGIVECDRSLRKCVKCNRTFSNPIVFMRHLSEEHGRVENCEDEGF